MFSISSFLFFNAIIALVLSAHRQKHEEDLMFDYLRLRDRSVSKYDNNEASKETLAIMLGFFEEILYRKYRTAYISNGQAEDHHPSMEGYYIRTAAELKERLTFAQNKYNRTCSNKNEDVVLFMCLITKLDGIHLQEWLTWQIVVTGANHIIVYLNDPLADHTWTVLQPFIQNGYVTAYNRTAKLFQRYAYDKCTGLIRQKVCFYPGYGPLPARDCPEGADIESFYYDSASPDRNHSSGGGSFSRSVSISSGSANSGTSSDDSPKPLYKRSVWMAGFDSDEFPIDVENYACYPDILRKYVDYPGLMIPWTFFGHNQYLLNPSTKLVTEAYTDREPTNQPDNNGKAFNRVNQILFQKTGHVADFAGGRFAVSEFFNYSMDYDFVNPPFPTYRLHHYVTKSVEHLLKKWIRGIADQGDHEHGRPVSEIKDWIQGYATNWRHPDSVALPMAKIVRFVLTGSTASPQTKAEQERGSGYVQGKLYHEMT